MAQADSQGFRFSLNDLYVIVVCLSILIGSIFWLGSVDSKASAAVEKAAIAAEGVRDLTKLVLEVRDSVIRIEEQQKRGK